MAQDDSTTRLGTRITHRNKCLVAACEDIVRSCGLCVNHYPRWLRRGKPTPIDPFLAEMASPKRERTQFIPPDRDRRMNRWDDGIAESACIGCGKVIPIGEFAIYPVKAYTGVRTVYRKKRCVPCEKEHVRDRGHKRKPKKLPTPCASCGGATGSGLRKYCPACRKKAAQRAVRRAINNCSSKIRQWKRMLIAQRGGRCERCGFTHQSSEVYDLHHKDPATKNKALSLVQNWEDYQIEAAKCLLLCANCHRITHWEERQEKKVKPVRKPKETAQASLFPIQ